MAKKVIVIPAEQVNENNDTRNNKNKKLRVAAYCRVSTDEEKQLGSFENQIEYYTKLIEENGRYELVDIFSDEGISGCSTKRRKGFNAMIETCEAGMVDLIITKSISRFARNTQDSLNYTRKLKAMGIGVYFEKEGINTIESSGELLLTLFSCFAQEESRNISENTAWGIRSKFQQGIPHLNAKLLLGYDKSEDGSLKINEAQAKVVRRIYRMFLEGYSLNRIASVLNTEGVPGVHGIPKWCATTIDRILQNEKYKGALLMQKTFTANYLTKQHVPNTGQLTQYYIEENHPPIIEKEEWEAVQEEIERRRKFREDHKLRGLSGGGEPPFYGLIFCSKCNEKLQRIYKKGVSRPYWKCMKCGIKIEEESLRAIFCRAFNKIVDERNSRMQNWESKLRHGTPLEKIRAKQIIEITEGGRIPFEVPELTRAVLQEAWVEYESSEADDIMNNIILPKKEEREREKEKEEEPKMGKPDDGKSSKQRSDTRMNTCDADEWIQIRFEFHAGDEVKVKMSAL